MENTQVDELIGITKSLGKLITEVKPDRDADWDALEKMTTSHKGLRSIDTASLRQAKMKIP